jgi:hypothetical protein
MLKLTTGLLLGLLLLATSAGAQEWKLVWSDEFQLAGAPDPNRWDYEQGLHPQQGVAVLPPRPGPENARVEDGCLVIETRKDGFEGIHHLGQPAHAVEGVVVLRPD